MCSSSSVIRKRTDYVQRERELILEQSVIAVRLGAGFQGYGNR
jgi:hypothetical protein